MKRLTYVECDIDRCGLTYGTGSSAWVKRQAGLHGSGDTVSHNSTDATWLSAIGSTHRTSGAFHFEIYLKNIVTHSPASINWRIGLCNGNLPSAGTPIGDSGFHSLAADDNGNIIIDGDVVETWSVPGNGQTAIIEVDLDNNLAWFATDAGAYSDPVDISSLRYGNSDSGTYEDNRRFPIFPAISLYHTGDWFSLIADESIFDFVGNVSTDYVPWGGSSCGAALRFDGGEAFDHGAGLFNGDTPPSSLIWRSGLTGAADSKLLTCSLWIKPEFKAGYQVLIGATSAGSLRLEVDITSAKELILLFRNSAGTTIVEILSRNYIPVDSWSHILFSLDTNSTSNRHLYINDIEAMGTVTTYTNDTIDFTFTNYWGIGARADDYAFSYLGAMAELWFKPGTYIDFSVEANRRKFITEFGRPVYLGENGELVTGNSPGDAPLIYLRFQGEGEMGVNYGTGGDFTEELISFATFHTGDFKCFNSRGSCQDPNNFLSDPQLVRFAVPADYLPKEIDCYPSIKDINFTPAILSLGETLGQRATLKVVCNDHPDNDAGPLFDKYIIERTYDAYTQGTFFGKFRARNPFPRGNTIRLVRGFLGDLRVSMPVRHFIIDSIDGPSSDGQFTFIAKDIIKSADDDRAQAPLLSSGYLLADISDVDVSATLSPSGIGDDEYPSSGYVAIGGSEIVTFTRAADVLTITRAQFNTVAVEHKAQDRVQLCLEYNAQDPALVVAELLTVYAGIDADYIDQPTWNAETALWLGNVYSALIAEPTSVKKLINEIVEQAALVIWWDDINQSIRLQVLREIATDADTFDDDRILLGSLDIKEQPDKKYSQVWTYFGKINPLVSEDQIDNYRSNAILIDSDAERDYGQAIKKIFSRWIPQGGRAVADRLNEVQLGRYRAPPRQFNFDLMCLSDSDYPVLGIGYQLEGWPLQTIYGDRISVPIQITRLNPGETICNIEAEEMQFLATTADPTQHDITIDFNVANVNLQSMHDSIYPEAESGDTVNCYIFSTVYSTSTTIPAFTVGTFAAGVDVNIFLTGKIEGAGGDGGTGGTYPGLQNGSPGNPGGTALYTQQAINLTDTNGAIWGGGGGGGGGGVEGISSSAIVGGGGGGGGAGFVAGAAGGRGIGTGWPDGQDGQAGTETAGGLGRAGGERTSPPFKGGQGGDGGDPGISGAAAGNSQTSGNPGGSGGSNGVAIDGIAFVTTIGGAGDRRGGTI